MVNKYAVPDTYDIGGVEIFSIGKWNGDEYTESDLNEMVRAFAETQSRMKPYLKLGHSDNQAFAQKDGLPAVGWVDSIRKVGNKLIADFKKVPKKIYELIKAGAYRRVSSEVFFNLSIEGKKYPRVLKAVALLGGDTPAVQNLDDIVQLYCADAATVYFGESETESRAYSFDVSVNNTNTKTEELKMEELEKVKADMVELQKKFDAEVEKVAKYTEQEKAFSEQVAKLEAEKIALAEQVKKYSIDALSAEINSSIDKLIAEKHIMPAEKEQFFTLLYQLRTQDGEVKKFKVGEKEHTLEDLVMGIVVARKYEINTDPKTEIGDTGTKEDNSDLACKAKKYAEENGVSYKEALKKVS